MIELLMKYYVHIIVAIILIILIIVGIVFRKQLRKKIKQETISFTALVISLFLATLGFITKQQTEVTTLAYVGGQRISLYFSIFWIFVVIFIIALIFFFRKELMKDISLR